MARTIRCEDEGNDTASRTQRMRLLVYTWSRKQGAMHKLSLEGMSYTVSSVWASLGSTWSASASVS